MPLPLPEPGLVIAYQYLWRHEHGRGRDNGSKVRPCIIVLAVDHPQTGAPYVTVVPVTHTSPDAGTTAVEMPPRVKRALGLDGERSWIVVDEVNRFTWPGFDLREIPGRPGGFAYGFIPPRLNDELVARILALAAGRRVTEIPRD